MLNFPHGLMFVYRGSRMSKCGCAYGQCSVYHLSTLVYSRAEFFFPPSGWRTCGKRDGEPISRFQAFNVTHLRTYSVSVNTLAAELTRGHCSLSATMSPSPTNRVTYIDVRGPTARSFLSLVTYLAQLFGVRDFTLLVGVPARMCKPAPAQPSRECAVPVARTCSPVTILTRILPAHRLLTRC
ncbi:hypothetical protein BD626DRAFT_520070 [Schizophyllum amplum]|uniref:Uncharacterized protein n=1 Tax=Schizophyllum amplum TaxID=97359 RepID=A0A550BUQ6_9AGAR|nr:hypothetical protein BD626DRAFT_520070 [Auriculariopsis ampla]